MTTPNNVDINIFVYSYKGKYLKDVIQNLIDKSSKKYTVGIGICDQHPLDRREAFEAMGVGYKHLFWDWVSNPSEHRTSNAMYSRSRYMLLISDNVMLSENWDEKLISSVNDNIIISGNSSVKINAKNLFYIKKEKNKIDKITETNFIDRDLIFGTRNSMSALNYPSYLKYNGVEETLSLDLFTKGLSIVAMPTDFYHTVGEPTMETLYVPFSLNHNYNESINLFKNGKNCCISILNRPRSVEDFCNYHSFDFKSLEPLPFATNDVEYDPEKLNFNQVDARRYASTTKAIH
jgi:hypothetical protein